MGGTRGRTEFVPSEAAIRDWLKDFSIKDHGDQAGSCTELMVCPGGCAQGDWSPLRVKSDAQLVGVARDATPIAADR